ncbi:MAG: YHYH protein, partial [bacterium]
MNRFVLSVLSLATTLFAGTTLAVAHPPEAGAHLPSRTWTNTRTGEHIEGSFLAAHAGKVALETSTGDIASIALADLAVDDRAFADARIAEIRAINESRVEQATAAKPVQAEIFEKFAPFVKTRFDERWLYVESDGLPHAPLETKMMVGITAWQQQVPLPQPYTGANAWQIPLKPELAEKPVLGKSNLMKGAVALAANGIPIFNALNNRGVDSFSIGELDEFGGHCGRADDYHYHAAPLAIEKIVGKGKPIAYALDGFPIYGLFDPKAKKGEDLACPCGSHEPLDEINGHFCDVPKGEGLGGGTRSYHYHAAKTFPYINGGMRGKVELSGAGPENEIVPQAHANGVRPALQALRGAKITGFEQTGDKAWSLRYEVGGKASFVNYRVVEGGKAIFEFVGPDGEKRVEEYMPRTRGGGGGSGGGPPREGRGGRDQQGGGQGGGGQGGGRNRGEQPPQRGPRNADSATGLSITCSGVGADGMLDAKHTCDGASVSPPFAWSGVPAGTTSIALTIHHITPDDTERVYLVRYGIPADTKSLSEGDTKVGNFGLNNVGRRAEYAPPCSQGPGEKTYIATLYVLSAEPKLSTATPTREELLAAIKDITLASGTLDLRYTRPDGASGAQGTPKAQGTPERPRGQRGGGGGQGGGGQGGGGQGG